MPKLSPVSYKVLARIFEEDGFVCVREEGDHMVFTKCSASSRDPKIRFYSGVHY
jgi:predicted RNA binding protein YcfA (HicA-like mRNA interferase family)